MMDRRCVRLDGDVERGKGSEGVREVGGKGLR